MANFFLFNYMIQMISYGNRHGNSGVKSYSFGADYILVEFNGAFYLYSYETPGYKEVLEMKGRAKKGAGLSGYISKHIGGVTKKYARA